MRDVQLVERINSHSVEAWHEFVHQYSDLIFSTLHRQLTAEDPDAIRTVYVDVLKNLYDHKLAKYEGISSLSTWLVIVTRGLAIDYLRRKGGRRRYPKGYQDLDPLGKRVFQLHFVEGLGFDAVLCTVNWDRNRYSVDAVAGAVETIHRTIDRRVLARLESERYARHHGIESGEVLEYLVYARIEYNRAAEDAAPDRELVEAEARRLHERVDECRERLSAREREALEMRFERGWRAKQIACSLGLDNDREAYSLVYKALRSLRRLLGVERA
jgi:RNA polymerase sigma factor (sigma-70 family)